MSTNDTHSRTHRPSTLAAALNSDRDAAYQASGYTPGHTHPAAFEPIVTGRLRSFTDIELRVGAASLGLSLPVGAPRPDVLAALITLWETPNPQGACP